VLEEAVTAIVPQNIKNIPGIGVGLSIVKQAGDLYACMVEKSRLKAVQGKERSLV
jgi:hypothetical protein